MQVGRHPANPGPSDERAFDLMRSEITILIPDC